MNIEDLTIKQAKELQSLFSQSTTNQLDQELLSLVGRTVTLFCVNYFYTGTLTGVSVHNVTLENPKIVYETGSFNDKEWKDAQELPSTIHVKHLSIESFGVMK